MHKFLEENKKIIDNLSFIVTIRCTDKDDKKVKNKDIYEVVEKGKLVRGNDNPFDVHTFRFDKDSFVLSVSVVINWEFCCMKFKVKKSENFNMDKISVNKYKKLTVNVDLDVLESVVTRTKFIENLFSTHDITNWSVSETIF